MKALNLKYKSLKEDNNHDSTLVFGCSSPAVNTFCEVFRVIILQQKEGRYIKSTKS